MCRRIILTLTILIATAVGAAAQHAIGEWEVFNSFTSAATSLIDTRDKVYLINDRNLYAYDKSDDELSSYNVNNGLSEMGIDEIYRNYDRDYIVVAYENSNIDVLYDNDRIVNMPDIKDAQSVTNKTINDIAFDGDIMFVATGFGLVKYDVKSHSVI